MDRMTTDAKKGDHITLTITNWIREKKDLPSCALEGTVKAVTEKAILIEGHATVRPSSHCHCCGREITNPTSLWCGYGPVCSDNLGIPRDATPEDLERVMEMLKESSPFEEWIPLSQIEEMETEPQVGTMGEDINLEDLF